METLNEDVSRHGGIALRTSFIDFRRLGRSYVESILLPRVGSQITVSHLLRLFLSILALAATQSVHAGEPQLLRDAQGNVQYMLMLNERLAEMEDSVGEPPARRAMDPANTTDIYGWQRPNVRALVKRLERTYDVKALVITSHALPAFAAYVPEAALERIRKDPTIDRIIPVYEGLSYFSSWTDQTSGAELIPWGKIAIGTNDALTTTNRVYMIDGAVPTSPSHNDLNLVLAPIST